MAMPSVAMATFVCVCSILVTISIYVSNATEYFCIYQTPRKCKYCSNVVLNHLGSVCFYRNRKVKDQLFYNYMKENGVTKFLVSFSGQIEYVLFPAGVFDEQLYLHYEVVWGPDWDPVSGLTSGTTQMACSGRDPEKVVFNMPIEMAFSSTNVFGWPQLVITVRAQNAIGGDSLHGYGVVLMPPTAGARAARAPLLRPRAATVLGEWLSWLTGRRPELADPKMLASGKENYLLRTESYGTVCVSLSMVSKDLRKLGYDNQPALTASCDTYTH